MYTLYTVHFKTMLNLMRHLLAQTQILVLSLYSVTCRNKAVKVICADISEDRLTGCKAVGADGGIVWPVQATEEDIVALTANTEGKMDAAFDFVGLPKTFRCAFYRWVQNEYFI